MEMDRFYMWTVQKGKLNGFFYPASTLNRCHDDGYEHAIDWTREKKIENNSYFDQSAITFVSIHIDVAHIWVLDVFHADEIAVTSARH